MDGFSKSLANLQRAASRAGGNEGGGGGSSGRGNGRDGDGASRPANNNSYRDNRREYDSSRDSSNRARVGGYNRDRSDQYGGRYGGGGRGGRSYDSRDGRRDRRDYDNDRSSDGHHSRKRGRYERDYDNRDNNRGGRGSYHHRGGRGGRSGGRGGGRWNDHRGDRRNNDWDQNHEHQSSQVQLSELVEQVAQKYKSAKEEESNAATTTSSGNDDVVATTTAAKTKRRHIALMFLTIDDLPHEHVWKEWLKSASKDYLKAEEEDGIGAAAEQTKATSNEDETCTPSTGGDEDNVLVSILCHAKFPERIKSSWLRQRHLLQQRRQTNDSNGSGDHTSSSNNNTSSNSPPRFHSRRPEWGSIEITRGMIDLLEEGLRIGSNEGGEGQLGYQRYLSTPGDAFTGDEAIGDTKQSSASTTTSVTSNIPPVDRFVFVSESCLPVATLKEMEMALFGPKENVDTNESNCKPPSKSVSSLYNKSWINARSTPNNGYARQLQWDAIRKHDIPHNFVWKADQWLVLNRTHGEAIASIPTKYLEGRHLWPALKKCRASDEMYFPTALSILGILHRPAGVSEVDFESSKKESCAGNEIRRRKITYCDWSMGAKNPASFTCVEWKDVVAKARGEGCLFARKFVLASSIRGQRKEGAPLATNSEDGLVSVEDWVCAVAKKGT